MGLSTQPWADGDGTTSSGVILLGAILSVIGATVAALCGLLLWIWMRLRVWGVALRFRGMGGRWP